MMKLLKPGFIVLTLLILFTSCLKDDNNSPITRYGIVTVQNEMLGKTQLKNDFGETFVVAVNNSGKDYTKMGRAIIIFKLTNEDDAGNKDKKIFDIDLISITSITHPTSFISRDSDADSLRTKYVDPIISFDQMLVNGDSVLAKDGYITAALDYRFSKNVFENRFRLFRYQEDNVKTSVNGPDTVDVHLGRNANGFANGEYRIRSFASGDINYWPFYYFAFEINKFIPAGYTKNDLVFRIHYKKDKDNATNETVQAIKLVKYPIKQ